VITTTPKGPSPGSSKLGWAWILQCSALAVQIWDAAVHDFIGYYNATMLTLYGHFQFFPRLDIESKQWLALPILLELLLLALTPLAFRNVRWIRLLAYALTLGGCLVAVGQIVATIRGGTVPSVRFERTSPGFFSSPLLLFASLWLFWSLRQTLSSNL
jgi:hypothetical protein